MTISYDALAKPLPPNLAPPEAWAEYGHVTMPKSVCAREEVGAHPKGIRWGVWPIFFEEYVSDQEPDVQAAGGTLAYPRFVAWKRLQRTDKPDGWFLLSRRPWRLDGYVTLPKTGDLTAPWDKKARYNLRLWEILQKAGRYKIEEISLAEFRAAYERSTVCKKMGDELLRVLERKFALGLGEHFSLFGVRNLASGDIIAGTAIAFSPSYKSSIRECPFILPEARKAYASTALVHRWHEEARARGMEHLYFTHFRQKGDPRDWAGFSQFKSQFGVSYIAHQPILWKFVGGKIW